MWALLLVLSLLLSSCAGSPNSRAAARQHQLHINGTPIRLTAPLGLPPVPAPDNSPPTRELVELGRTLFFSRKLSVDGTLSCASCHDPATAFADPRPVSLGVRGRRGKRNAPTVLNAAYYRLLFWDGRARSLEEQASGPILNDLEMAHSLEGLLRTCEQDSELRASFRRAYGQGPISLAKITHALASFERTLLSGDSPFDRFFFAGDRTALSPAARRGLEIFRHPAKGNCAACHTIGERDALFTDQAFHNLGVGLDPEGHLTDLGRFLLSRRDLDRGAFRTPSLRNVALTAPYMHDGSLKTLKEVVDFYVGGGSWNPYLDKQIKPLTHLSAQERADLVAFLESLTGQLPKAFPPSP